MADETQPTILVKKADGSTVRMTMDEFRAYQKQKTSGAIVAPASSTAAATQAPATSAPPAREPARAQTTSPAQSAQAPRPQKDMAKGGQDRRQPPPRDQKKPRERDMRQGNDRERTQQKRDTDSAAQKQQTAIQPATKTSITVDAPVSQIFVDEAMARGVNAAKTPTPPIQIEPAKTSPPARLARPAPATSAATSASLPQANQPATQSPRVAAPNMRPGQTPPTWKKEDASALLTEEPGEQEMLAKDIAVRKPSTATAQTAETILKTVGWDVGGDVRKRMVELIDSRLRDVRTDDQFLSYAMTPSFRGGMGLSPEQAQTLYKAVKQQLPDETVPTMPVSAPKTTQTSSSITRVVPPKVMPTEPKILSATTGSSSPLPSARTPTTPLQSRPRVADVLPPSPGPKSMGPQEEMASFTLADFRRLAPTPEAALSRLKEKFDTLKAESYLLYLDTRNGWFSSPLYRAYVVAVETALREGKKMQEVIAASGTKDVLTMNVVDAIIALNKHVSV